MSEIAVILRRAQWEIEEYAYLATMNRLTAQHCTDAITKVQELIQALHAFRQSIQSPPPS